MCTVWHIWYIRGLCFLNYHLPSSILKKMGMEGDLLIELPLTIFEELVVCSSDNLVMDQKEKNYISFQSEVYLLNTYFGIPSSFII